VAAALALASCDRSAPDGAKLYATMACAQCHGSSGEGSSTAPPLTDLARHWDRARLATYLADPRSFLAKDERLAALKRHYPIEMPALSLPEAERLAIAEHVLAFPKP
jgi:cytochrome c2